MDRGDLKTTKKTRVSNKGILVTVTQLYWNVSQKSGRGPYNEQNRSSGWLPSNSLIYVENESSL